MNLKKAAIAVALVSSAGVLWASMTVPVLPVSGFAAHLARPLLAPVRPALSPVEVTPLEDRLRLQALVLTQA